MNDKIKMFIADEEVVSNNDFTINEEMLSASSTILNNCYPKSWELTKDYVSNFYYPKDYSRFVLAQGEYEHGNQEFQPLEITGKNLFNLTGIADPSNIAYLSNGIITLTWSSAFDLDLKNAISNLDTTKTYTVSFKHKGTSLKVRNTSVSQENIIITGTDNDYTLYSVSINNISSFQFRFVRNETTGTAYLKDFQLEEGNQATTYEPYNQPNLSYETNVEKEINTFNIYGRTYQETSTSPAMPSPDYPSELVSVGYQNLYEGSQDFSGTWNNSSYWETDSQYYKGLVVKKRKTYWQGLYKEINVEENEKYTFSVFLKSDSARAITIYTQGGTGTCSPSSANFTSTTDWKLYSLTFTATTGGTVRLRIENTTASDTNYTYICGYQLIKGTQIHSYIPYGKYGIEITNTGITYDPYKSNTQLYVLDEPLRQIGSYKDKLYTDGRVLYVKREVGNFKMTDISSNINSVTTYQGNFNSTNGIISLRLSKNYFETLNIVNSNQITVGMSNTFTASSTSLWNNTNQLGRFGYTDGLLFGVHYTQLGLTEWAVWPSNLTTRLNEHFGDTEFYLPLATPTITPLGYIDLPSSYEGQNNVSIYTGLNTRTEIYYYWKNYDVLFAGVVKNSGDISLNPRHPHYCSLQILDYKTFLSESNTLDFVIANKTIKEAIEMVVNAVKGYGFVVGNIDIDSANDNIGAYSTLNKTAYDVLQYLAEISGSRWRARVIDSLTMAIDFYDPDTLPEADDIEYTKQYWEDNNIVDMTFNYGSRDYRNKQILLSNEVYGNINYEETLISNGYGDTFTVQNNIGVLLTVIVDGTEKTIATINDKQMGIDADFYYTPGKNIIESNGVYSAGTMIRATYQPLVKGRQIVYNASEVERISDQTQTEGVIARYETRNDILSSEELQKIAQTYIDYKGKAEVIIKITTQDNDLYDIGEVVYFNAPIDDLKQNYMVKAKDIEYIIIDKIIHLFYVYELTSSFNSEKAINYFDNQRNKASGNIAEGESITRNIDIETEVGIIWTDGSVSSTTITVDGDNVLNSVLNSPFVE